MLRALLRPSLLAFLFLAAHPLMAQTVQSPPAYWPTQGWRSTTPEQQGLDSNKLADVLDYIRERGVNIHSLLIVRNGFVVLDAYFYPYDGTSVHDVASATKVVTPALVGAAIQQGKLKDVRQPALPLLPDHAVSDRDPRKERISVEHLLTMTSGLDCEFKDREKTLREMQESPDWVRFMLSLPMVDEPGRKFEYCSGGMHLLSAIISRTTGMSAHDFARRSLFEPLGIRDEVWPSDPQGVSHGWGDLHLYPRDMAKLGYLWLNDGTWDGRRILPPGWAAESTRVHAKTGTESDYGYGWLLKTQGDQTLYEAVGRGGQRISVVPGKNIIVVLTGGGFQPGEVGQLIAAAVKSDSPLPESPGGVARLRELVEAAVKPPAPKAVKPLPPTAAKVSGKTYLFEPNPLKLKSISLTFSPGATASVQIAFTDNRVETRPVGLDGVERLSPGGRFGLPVGVKGSWEGPDTFSLEYDEIANINYYQLRLDFDAQRVSLNLTERSSGMKAKLAGKVAGQ